MIPEGRSFQKGTSACELEGNCQGGFLRISPLLFAQSCPVLIAARHVSPFRVTLTFESRRPLDNLLRHRADGVALEVVRVAEEWQLFKRALNLRGDRADAEVHCSSNLLHR